jgi:hypothetical protein
MTEKLLERLRAGSLTLLVERGGKLGFASDRPGIRPVFRAVLEHPEIFEGADVATRSLGLALAYLFLHAKVARVSTGVITREAERALEEGGVALAAEQKLKALKEGKDADPGEVELDQIARDVGTVGRFIDELRQRLA